MRPARLLVEALRLDRSSAERVRRRARAAVDLGVGGFVIFGGQAEEVAALTSDLRQRAGRPLWFAADLERGAGQQFRGTEDLPPPAALAHHPGPEEAVRTAARLTAREALSVGVNWVLAPVLDLDVEPANPIVGTRSFGDDPERVASLGRTWIEACQAEGAAACMKHVPGHGRTLSDSHAELPVVEADAGTLEADLEPFRRAGPVVATAMLAHVAYPALAGGSRRPATVEPALATDLLRGGLDFGGPAATDAMNMAGFGGAAGDGADDGAVAALRAGCDLLLYPTDLRSAAAGLARAAGRSAEVRTRLDEAIGRSERALASLGSDAGGRRVEPPAELPGPEALDRLAEACIVEVGDPPERLMRSAGDVEVVILDDDAGSPASCAGAPSDFGRAFLETLAAGGVEIRGTARGPEEAAARKDALEDGPSILLVRATPRAWKGRAALAPELDRAVAGALGAGAYPLIFGHRRLLEGLGRPGACVWWGRPRAERAAARWLMRALAD